VKTFLLSSAAVAILAVSAPALSAKDRVYHGVWEDTRIEARLRLDEPSGRIDGTICPFGTRDEIIAAVKGRMLDDGGFRLDLTYRFESLGSFTLRPATSGTRVVWQTQRKEFWLALRDGDAPWRAVTPPRN
jgi:hypothetical protein